jgi:serine/threonine protein kinase
VHWKNVSVEAKRLISGLLTVSAEKRWTSGKALASDWFREKDRKELVSTDLSKNLAEMKKFKARRAWKSAAKAISWATSAPFWNPDAVSFQQQLQKWDKAVLSSSDSSQSSVQSKPSSEGDGPIMSTLPKIKFGDVYDLEKKLRKGSYATVWECIHKQSKEKFAVKVIQRENLEPKDDEAVLNEVAVMQSLIGNKYVVQLLDFYEEPNNFYIVMEFMHGGDVFDRVTAKTSYTEKDARDLAFILLKAVKSMHISGVAHRDIKPQNLLLECGQDDARIKIADFGFARRVHTPESLTSRVGTPTFVAPEILKNVPHDERVDLWSIGVVIFVLLVGYPPFLEENQSELFHKIRNGEWEFHTPDWRHISDDAMSMIRGLLTVDPKERWTLDEALRCSWIRQNPDMLSSTILSESVKELKRRRTRLRSLAKAFVWLGKENKIMEVPTQAQSAVSRSLEQMKTVS